MKCILYSYNADMVKAMLSRFDLSGSDDAKAKLSPEELAALSSLTGFECHKAQVQFGTLKEEGRLGSTLMAVSHEAGAKVIVAEVSNGIRVAVFVEGDTTAKDVPPLDDQTKAAGNAPPASSDGGGVIVPPAPPQV